MKPRMHALLVGENYEEAQLRLTWPCADMAALGRTLAHRCRFERVVVLNRHADPFFSEGRLGDLQPLVRALAPRSLTRVVRAEEVLAAARLSAWERALLDWYDPAIPEDRDRLEPLLVRVLNQFLLHSAEPARQLAELRRILPAVPDPSPEASTVREGESLEFRGRATRATLLQAAQELIDDLREEDLFLFAFGGHGFEASGSSYLLLQDAGRTPTFTRAGSLNLNEIVRPSGYQVIFTDICRTPLTNVQGHRSSARHGSAEELRNLVGAGAAAVSSGPGPVSHTLGTLPPPERGAVAVLQACWQGESAFDSRALQHGKFSRFVLEALNGRAWSGARVYFDGTAQYVGREMQDHCRMEASVQHSARERQEAYLHWSGRAVPLLLGTGEGALYRDARLWTGVPRLTGMVVENEFRLNTLGLSFVYATTAPAQEAAGFLVAVHPVRVDDYRRYTEATAKPMPPQPADSGPQHPVVNVTPAAARDFAAWFTREDHRSGRLPRWFFYGLPTDEEWDAVAGLPTDRSRPTPAARSEGPMERPFDETPAAPPVAPASGPGPVESGWELPPLGLRRPVPGVRGLVGGASEICDTPYDPARLGDYLTRRGPSWRVPVAAMNLTVREWIGPEEARDEVGFRLVLRERRERPAGG